MRLVYPSFFIRPHLEYANMLHICGNASCHCYKKSVPSGQKEIEALIAARIKSGHESVIEHVGFSVTFIVDRGVTHEMVRHRLCSFTQESTRYCDYSKSKFGEHVTFVIPPFIRNLGVQEGEYGLMLPESEGKLCLLRPDQFAMVSQDESNLRGLNIEPWQHIEDRAAYLWLIAVANAESAYLNAVESTDSETPALLPPEIARGILPHATKAEITWTANMREWRHIFRLRALGTTGRPHPQMVEVMFPLFVEAQRRFPVFFNDLSY